MKKIQKKENIVYVEMCADLIHQGHTSIIKEAGNNCIFFSECDFKEGG